MNDKVRICHKHGELEEKDIRAFFYKGWQHRQCRICNREADRKRNSSDKRKLQQELQRKKQTYKEKSKIRAINYRERRAIVSKELYKRKKVDPEFIKKSNESSKKRHKKSSNNLTDGYIRKIYFKGIKRESIPEELIELKRAIVKINRKIKEKVR